ncbi:MAG TPA: glycosyltransferase [Candidatus Krumholzibacteria bacterium]
MDFATEPAVASTVLAGPALRDVGVLALVPERWGGMWLSRHQVLTRLARYFNVVWHSPAPSWRHGARPIRNPDPTAPPAHGFFIHESKLPKFYRPRALDRATERARLAASRRLLERAGSRRMVTYLWRPEFGEALDMVAHDVSCYHIADEYSFADQEHPISTEELALIQRVDQVFVHSPALMEKKGHINPNTAYVTNGVDYAAFATPVPEPADMAAIPHPRIGYIGRIKKQMDWRTLLGIARRHPEWSVVLVGPLGQIGEFASEKEELFALSNVHYLGNRSIAQIPAYMQHMDVCLLCYALTDYTRYIFPLKLHEYLATGRPVVGSDIRTLRDFNSTVRIAHDLDGWCDAIEASLEPGERTRERVEERRRVARAYDWNTITARIAVLLCERLGGDAPERLHAAMGGKG